MTMKTLNKKTSTVSKKPELKTLKLITSLQVDMTRPARYLDQHAQNITDRRELARRHIFNLKSFLLRVGKRS